jgi:hypothetical protein
MANHPRTFEEVVAAQDPAERKQRKRDEHYRDRAVEQDFHADVWLVEDRNASGIWRVEYQDDNGGCYVNDLRRPRSREAGPHLLRGVADEAPAHDPRGRPVSVSPIGGLLPLPKIG